MLEWRSTYAENSNLNTRDEWRKNKGKHVPERPACPQLARWESQILNIGIELTLRKQDPFRLAPFSEITACLDHYGFPAGPGREEAGRHIARVDQYKTNEIIKIRDAHTSASN